LNASGAPTERKITISYAGKDRVLKDIQDKTKDFLIITSIDETNKGKTICFNKIHILECMFIDL